MMLNKVLGRTLSTMLTVAVLTFSYFYISDLVSEAKFAAASINWLLISLAVVLFVVYYGLMSLNWLFSTRLFDKKSRRSQMLVFLASQPFKYLPTSLFVFSSRAVYGKKLGLNYKQSTIAQLFENASIFISNFYLFFIFYFFEYSYVLSLLVAVIGVVGLIWIYKVGDFNLRIKNRKIEIESKSITFMLTSTALGWLACGLSFVFLNLSLGINLEFNKVMAANMLAFSLSILAFFAPGGIGIRELVYEKFGLANIAIIYWRIVVFVMDMVLGVPAILLIRHKTRAK